MDGRIVDRYELTPAAGYNRFNLEIFFGGG